MQRKVEILRKRLQRSVGPVTISDDMPDDIAADFLAEMRLCPDCAAAAAQNWVKDPTPATLRALTKWDEGDKPSN